MAKEKEIRDIPEVPANPRKPTGIKRFSMNDYKKKIKAEDIPDKPLEWIKLSDALETATGMKGYLKGYVTTFCGYSNTGKSTALELGVVEGQKAGLLPIIIDTENNISKYRLELMGFDWSGNYISIDNEYLLQNFGKKLNPKRKQAAIEDLANCIRFFIREQENGDLPFDLLFAIDSIGTLDCSKKIDAKEANAEAIINIDADKAAKLKADSNYWNAGAYESEFMDILFNLIPNSRKVNKPYTNTFIAVQKIGFDAQNVVITMKGGKTWEFGPRLQYFFGGVLTKGVKRITATSKKREVSYGTMVRANILKNHLDGPLGGLSMEGQVISVPHGFIEVDKVEEYKKNNILYFRNLFGDDVIADDIESGEKIVNLKPENDGLTFDKPSFELES